MSRPSSSISDYKKAWAEIGTDRILKTCDWVSRKRSTLSYLHVSRAMVLRRAIVEGVPAARRLGEALGISRQGITKWLNQGIAEWIGSFEQRADTPPNPQAGQRQRRVQFTDSDIRWIARRRFVRNGEARTWRETLASVQLAAQKDGSRHEHLAHISLSTLWAHRREINNWQPAPEDQNRQTQEAQTSFFFESDQPESDR